MIKKIVMVGMVLMVMMFAGSALASTETNDNNYFGQEAGTVNLGDFNSFFGGYTGNNNKGSNNTFLGFAAGVANTTGDDNTFVGYKAGHDNSTGYDNNFMGSDAGYQNDNGYWNNYIGRYAGYKNTAGYGNNVHGDYAGFNNTGNNNIFIGDSAGGNNITESYNTLIGYHADIDGTTPGTVTNATAIGNLAYVGQANSVVLGSIAGVNSATSSVNVGIGTSAPARQLHIAGDNAVFRMDRNKDTAAFMLVRTDGSGNPQKTFVVGANSSGSGVGTFVINDLGTAVSGGGTNRMTINNDGSVTFTGNVYANSFVPSSIAYKDNVRTYENAMDTVNKLRGVKFDWKDSGKSSVGLIAEEVEKVVPEIVAHNEGNATGVNYASLVGVLVEAFKEQQEAFKKLQEKNEQLEQRLLVLEGK